jgi:hypothetical protein
LLIDANPTGLGKILAQTNVNDKRRVISYASEGLNLLRGRMNMTGECKTILLKPFKKEQELQFGDGWGL